MGTGSQSEFDRLRDWFADVAQKVGPVPIVVIEWYRRPGLKKEPDTFEWPFANEDHCSVEWLRPAPVEHTWPQVYWHRAFRAYSEGWNTLRAIALAAGHLLPGLHGVHKYVRPRTLAIPDAAKLWVFALSELGSGQNPDAPFSIPRYHWMEMPTGERRTIPATPFDPQTTLALGSGSDPQSFERSRWFARIDDVGSLSARACRFLIERLADSSPRASMGRENPSHTLIASTVTQNEPKTRPATPQEYIVYTSLQMTNWYESMFVVQGGDDRDADGRTWKERALMQWEDQRYRLNDVLARHLPKLQARLVHIPGGYSAHLLYEFNPAAYNELIDELHYVSRYAQLAFEHGEDKARVILEEAVLLHPVEPADPGVAPAEGGLELTYPISNARLAELADIVEGDYVSRTIRDALGQANQAVPKGSAGKPRFWTHRQLAVAMPHLPEGKLLNFLKHSGFK